MTNQINKHLAKSIADVAVFLEFSGDKVDADASVQALEQMAAELQGLEANLRNQLVGLFKQIAAEMTNTEHAAFVFDLGETFGLT